MYLVPPPQHGERQRQRRKPESMSKIVTSPVKRWAGTVTLADPLTEAQAIEIERAEFIFKEAEERAAEAKFKDLQEALNRSAKLKVVKACVEKWELQDFVSEPFPFSPRADSRKMIDFLYEEIRAVYFGEAVVPNE